MRCSRTLACAIGALSVTIGAHAQTTSVLLRTGDTLSGGAVSDIASVAANNVGGFAVLADVGSTEAFYGTPDGLNPAILRTRGTFGMAEQTAIEAFYGIADDGSLCYSATANIDFLFGIDSLWLDDALLMQTDSPIPGAPGAFAVFTSRPRISASGVPVWIAGMTSQVGGFVEDTAILRGNPASLTMRGGQPIPTTGQTIVPSGIDFDYAISADGTDLLARVDLSGPSTADSVVVLNGSPLLVDGDPVREGSLATNGRIGETWSSFDFFGINDAGDTLITGESDTEPTRDHWVNVNGQFVLREGTELVFDATVHTVTDTIDNAVLGETGDWAALWDGRLPLDAGVIELLIINGAIGIRQGDPVDLNNDGLINDDDLGAVLGELGASLAIGPPVAGIPTVYFTADVIVDGETHDAALKFGGTVNPCPCELGGEPDEVDIQDLLIFLGPWLETSGQSVAPGTGADFNGDGLVSILDLLEYLDCWLDTVLGAPCP